MSGQQNQPPPRGWSRGPQSPIHYQPPSPWGPSPPPIISGPRPQYFTTYNSPKSPVGVGHSPGSTPLSPMFGSTGLRGTRGPQLPCPRPMWPSASQPTPVPQPYVLPPLPQRPFSPQPPTVPACHRPFSPQQQHHQLPPPVQQHSYPTWPGSAAYHRSSPSPAPIANSGPKPFRPMPFSPVHMYSNSTPNAPPINQSMPFQHSQSPSLDAYYSGPAPLYEMPRYEYVGVPLESVQGKSFIIYDDDEEHGPSTAEIIANQSQDYVDEKLAEYQMTIAQLQGKSTDSIVCTNYNIFAMPLGWSIYKFEASLSADSSFIQILS